MKSLHISLLFACFGMSSAAQAQTPLQSTNPSQAERLYEQRGFCAAQRDSIARLRCYEKLTAELFSALAAASRQAASTPPPLPALPPPPTPQKSAQELEAERVALVNKTWNGVFRAFTAMEASIAAGVSYMQYGPLLQAAATELALAEQVTKTAVAKIAVAYFEDAIDAYRDAATWWERDISFYSRRDNNLSYGGGLPFSQVGLDSMVAKWSIPTRGADLLGVQRGVPRTTALQTMWRAASSATEAARQALLEPPRPTTSTDPQPRKEELDSLPW
jgi:hypothetical protein